MKGIMTILSAKRSKGEFDGRPYETAKCLVITDEDLDKENTTGLVCTEMKFDYNKYHKVPKLPAVVEVDFTIRPNGTVINDFLEVHKTLKLEEDFS